MKKERAKKTPVPPDDAPVLELDEAAAPGELSLQELADALGAQMEQAREEAPSEEPVPDDIIEDKKPAKPAAAPTDEETHRKLRELEETVKQLVAENRNQKTRLENDLRAKMKYALEPFLREIIVVKDDLEKALSFAPDSDDEKTAAFIDGVRHLNANIDALFKRFCVESFDAAGRIFDPALHQAMRLVDVAGKPANEVVSQYLKGWLYRDRVLRPAMVEVASGNEPVEAADKKDEDPAEITTETNDTEETNG